MVVRQRRAAPLRVRGINDWANIVPGEWNIRLLELSSYRTKFWPNHVYTPLYGIDLVVLGLGFQINWERKRQ